MENTDLVITRHADVTVVLGDPRFVVQPAGSGARRHSLAWLRQTVSRFSEGADHERRRALVVRALDAMSPADLRLRARDRVLAGDDPERAPVLALGGALGVTEPGTLARAVPAAASGYLTGEGGPGADRAVAALARLLGPGPDEEVAGRIAILMQACEATAELVRRTLPYARRPESRGRPAERVIAETLRFDPPVPVMRRVAATDARLGSRAVPRGTVLVLDLRAANRDPAVFEDPDRFDPGRREGPHLTFGAGRRPCPAADHAPHLAAGVVEAVLSGTEVHR
ncbi:cytochrome P450 [Actinomadura sp. KC216]|uniref:cytochrome P450 n=1 Tax=Actinomadura sp. KC216 TaxID=2530370 RepID=UPI00104EA3D5|nr:cytochrome P450 [Actinomadura sp. KC216]TDB89907.1 cytochrome P450 [Actinomadura sp. KC216]